MTRLPPILVLTVIGAIAAFSVMRVHFSANLYEMMPPDLPEVQGMDRLNRYFSRDGQLIVTVQAEEGFAAVEAVASLSKHLADHEELVTEVFRELTLTELVTDGGELLAWLWLNAPAGKLEALGERLTAGQSVTEIANAMEAVQSEFFDQDVVIRSYDPLGISRLGDLLGDGGPDPMSSADGTFQIMYVEGSGVDFSDYRDAAKWLGRMKEIVAAWEANWIADHVGESPVVVGLTGTPAFMAEVGAKMERDMSLSVVSTMVLIALLFWVMHRQSKPLSWIISAMLAILSITIGLGGVVFGDLSVMSAGFAAILMGLAVDYGIIVYREAMDSGNDARTLRKNVGPSICWAAATTAVVFLALNLSSLPGLAEMGNLVAMGVVVGAIVMLYGFAPIAVSFARQSPQTPARPLHRTGTGLIRRCAGLFAWLIPLLTLISIAGKEMPGLEIDFHPFRIRESPSMITWQTLQKELRGRENSVPTVITGSTLPDLHANLEAAENRIDGALASGLLSDATLPTVFIPHPEHQKRNAILVRQWLGEEDRLLAEIRAAGFSEEGTAFTATTFSAWRTYLAALDEDLYAAPVGKLAAWSVERLFADKEGSYAALATVKPTAPLERTWVAAVSNEHTVVASLGSLGTALNERIGGDVVRVFLPMIGILALMLILVFRSWKDLLLSLFSLLFVTFVMVLATIWTPMSWNSFNICGLPLLFGTGLDYGIHMILALRRNGGNIAAARGGIGKALIFCGTSTAIGFGSLATASAYGLASLGLVCVVGLLLNMLVAVFLLPHWYRWMHRLGDEP